MTDAASPTPPAEAQPLTITEALVPVVSLVVPDQFERLKAKALQ